MKLYKENAFGNLTAQFQRHFLFVALEMDLGPWRKLCRNMSMLALLREFPNLPTKFTFFVNKIARNAGLLAV